MSSGLQSYLNTAQQFVADHIPQDRNNRILLAGGTLTVAAIVLFPIAHFSVLGRQVSHTHPNAGSRSAALDCGEIEKLPKDVVESPHLYRIAHDKVVKRMRNFTIMLSAEHAEQFTKLLRYNMVRFSRTPQSWAMWFLFNSEDQRETFKPEHIEGLEFDEGDVFCGAYEVVKRTPLRVEIAIRQPHSQVPVYGLLIVSLRPRNDGAALSTETIQWAKKDTGVYVLPLEKGFWRFLHDWSARWLTVTGAQYLQSVVA